MKHMTEKKETIILIDIGGTAVKYGLFSIGEMLFLEKGKMDTPVGGEKILSMVYGIIDDYRRVSSHIIGVGVSSAGIIDSDRGVVYAANADLMPDYTGCRIAPSVTEYCGLPCHVENDVNCAALAEYHIGAAKFSKSSLTITVGTGIGAAFINEGILLKGNTFSACEVGYMHMGNKSFEELGATSALVKKTAAELGIPKHELDGVKIFERADANDAICVKNINEMCAVLAEGIANICYVLNPETVVIGGGISARKDVLFPRLREGLKEKLIPEIYENTSLRFAENGNDAGMLGAYYAWKQAMK